MDPLVFLPGWMCDARLFGAVSPMFGRDRMVIHAPLIGGSVDAMAEAIAPNLPPRCILIGQDLGGNVALELARRSPTRISQIVLVGSLAQAETPQTAADYEGFLVAARAGRLDAALRDWLPARCVAPGNARNAVVNDVVTMAGALTAEVVANQTRALQRRPDQQAILRRLKMPLDVVGGELDAFVPVKRQQFMAELAQNGRFQAIPGAGHYPTLEQPGLVAQAMAACLAQ